MNNFKIIHTHHVHPQKPSHLCASFASTSSGSILLHCDASSFPNNVHLLDCSGFRPKLVQGKNVIRTKQSYIHDMCVARDRDKEFLVITDGERVYAYNTAAGELVWSPKRKQMNRMMGVCGVSTDGRGHLFVCDWNNQCIQMFRVGDGRYLGAVMTELGSEYFYRIR